ncbi:MAG TPA: ZIP family metal transporter, partial [bacterium]|nr:ZIP family metal transporter [bacterium]
MAEWFSELSPVWQSFLATVFTWAMTAAGAALVFFFKTASRKV